ncbi:MAG: 4-alpha-glucanotransferase [Planctomycetes bacterium]|nr:4-alpha-glucanotransferase [Planctomycetota bacterium]
MKRSSGILLHISSLASGFGVGDLGPAAFAFADFLARTGQRYWQVLPVNPPTVNSLHCPYSAVSAFAGDPLFISPKLLHRSGLLTKQDITDVPNFPSGRVDYTRADSFKRRLLKRAYKAFKAKKDSAFEAFCDDHSAWLDDFSLFMVLRDKFQTGFWNQWPKGLACRDGEALAAAEKEFASEIVERKFYQYIFFKQWHSLKAHCNKRGVKIIGDIPIYVAFDSADVWANQSIFKLSKSGKPLFVTGTPPDGFCKTGQLWGNPVYDWKALKKADFKWWIDRIGHNLAMCDLVRIDHFRGLIAFWQVPAGNKTAKNGRWVRTPKDSFLDRVFKEFSRDSMIVEDLGVITPAVRRAVDKYGLYGMKILQWAGVGKAGTNEHDLKNHIKRCVAYTGTHDNNTLMGWLEDEAGDLQKKHLLKAAHAKAGDTDIHFKLIEYLLTSRANLTIIPIQDILALGSDCRMNTPSTIDGNWQWQMIPRQIKPSISRRLKIITQKTRRV